MSSGPPKIETDEAVQVPGWVALVLWALLFGIGAVIGMDTADTIRLTDEALVACVVTELIIASLLGAPYARRALERRRVGGAK